MKETKSAKVRNRLDHPVIDSDGHWLEPAPVFYDYLKTVAGPEFVDDVVARNVFDHSDRWYNATPSERMRSRLTRPFYWGTTMDADARATAMIPRLMYERLDEFGIDYMIVYPSLGLSLQQLTDDDLRHASVRALNMMTRDLFMPFADRMTPAATVPTTTPAEAIAEAEYAVKQLGMKVVMIAGSVRRPIEAEADWQPDVSKRRHFIDGLGMDSPYDYDPFWSKLVELEVAATSHKPTMDLVDSRISPSSWVFNHIGHFAHSHHITAKALFLGGVTQRFPNLNFAFLEGGTGWAANLYTDLIAHWQKVNRDAWTAHFKPSNLDVNRMRMLFDRYATDEHLQKHIDRLVTAHHALHFRTLDELTQRDLDSDEFSRVNIRSEDDIKHLFADNFYFGCEADDPMTAVAFNDRLTTRLKPVLGSDIGHFDVTDMTEVLEEAWELVEHGLINEQDYRELTFSNPATLHARMNPHFFKGTVVETAVEKELTATKRGQHAHAAS